MTSSLVPKVISDAKKKLQHCQMKQKYYYDQHVKVLPTLNPNDIVRYQTSSTWKPAVFTEKDSTPRSYNLITTNNTKYTSVKANC